MIYSGSDSVHITTHTKYKQYLRIHPRIQRRKFLWILFFCSKSCYPSLVNSVFLSCVVITNFIKHNRSILFYSVCLAAILVLLNWLKLRFVIIDHAFEIYVGAVAVLFTAVGIWLGLKLTRPKQVVITRVAEKKKPFRLNESALEERNITKRELEVLQLIAQGLSNQEIADRLFLSLSTVKSHSNNLFDKLGVQRRTQAVDQGRKLELIP